LAHGGEANTFSGTFLALPILIKERFNDSTIDKIAAIRSTFLISEDAAKHRFQDYVEWTKSEVRSVEKQLLKLFGLQMHPRYCSKCSNLFYDLNARYCPICGNGSLSKKWRKDHMLYDDGAKTNELNQVIECARCENEDINSDEEYCNICVLRSLINVKTIMI
jgi:ribosomal protein L37E